MGTRFDFRVCVCVSSAFCDVVVFVAHISKSDRIPPLFFLSFHKLNDIKRRMRMITDCQLELLINSV